MSIKLVIVGAGNRGMTYASLATDYSDKVVVVGVVDPDGEKRRLAADKFCIPQDQCFSDVSELIKNTDSLGDIAINGTMDQYHVATTIPLLENGYDVLLEKPIAPTYEQLIELMKVKVRTNKQIMLAHVFRYAPFFADIRACIESGEIGHVTHIHTAEYLSYHHMAVGFVRGKWRNDKDTSPMILAKCCHDLDILCWLKEGISPRWVSSFGDLTTFRKENAPSGSGERCLVDCSIEENCPYSAKKHYIEQELWGIYVWPRPDMTLDEKLTLLKRSDDLYGRCVWRCDNDVVDHQSVMIKFEDGTVATHDMVGGAPRPSRFLHITGSKGEIFGRMEDYKFIISKPFAQSWRESQEKHIPLHTPRAGHGGGDIFMMREFVKYFDEKTHDSICRTRIETSIDSHLLAYAAEKSRCENKLVDFCEFKKPIKTLVL